MTQRALIVAARNPWPARRGDQMRTLDFTRALRELRFEVELMISDRGPAPADRDPASARFFPPTPYDRLRGLGALARGAPVQTLPYRAAALEAELVDAVARLGPDDIVLVQLARQAPLLERLHRHRRPGGPTVIVDLIDVLSLNFERRAQIESGPRGVLWRAEARRLQHVERDLVAWSDAITLVCERDRLELVRLDDGARTKAVVTPLPVALEKAPVPSDPDTIGRRLVFTGNLGYFVNEHAILTFLERVWPLLRSRRTELELVVAGARPGRRLRAACARAGADLLADPSDLRTVLRTADLALAPLVGGAGVPVKVLEAWSEGVPVAASEWCARGLLGENETLEALDEVLFRLPDLSVAEVVASSIEAVLADPESRRARTTRARQRLGQRHSVGAFRASVGELVEVGRAQRSAHG